MDYLTQLNWRYATKRMNGGKVPQEKIDRILEAIRLSASSMGLQPYTVLIIENEELRKKIRPVSYNQPQITEASHLLVFAAWKDIPAEKVDAYIRLISSERNVPESSLDDFKKMILGAAAGKDAESLFNWNAHQAYIALGSGMVAAAMEEVDSTPMEGFDPQALDKILKLEEKGLKSVAMLALGYRDADADYLTGMKKVRRAKEDLFLDISSLS